LNTASHPASRAWPPPDPVIEAYKRDVDVSLLIENLRMSVEERLLALMSLQNLIDEMRAGIARSRADR
jgi:hypothetical protein